MDDIRHMKKNVLFIISHDFGPIFGACGDQQAITPNIDAFAKRSVQMGNHYCQYPLCGPSRACMYSGTRPHTAQRWDHQEFYPRLRERMGIGFETLSGHFKRNGYHAKAFWQFHHGVGEDDGPGFSEPTWDDPHYEGPALPEGSPANLAHNWAAESSFQLMRDKFAKLQSEGTDPFANVRKWRGPAVEIGPDDDEAYVTGRITRAAREYVGNYYRDEPFFLGVGYPTGHLPWCAPKKYFDLYNRDRLQLPPNQNNPGGSPDWSQGDIEATSYYTTTDYEQPWAPDEAQKKELLHGHLAAASYWDAQVGRLMQAIEDNGLLDSTVIVLTSDHGFHTGQHGYFGKHNLWDMSTRTPLWVYDPSIERAGETVRAFTEHVDVYPTLCDLCGLEKPSYLEGDSFLPLMQQPDRVWKEAVFAVRRPMPHDRIKNYFEAKTVRNRRYRLIRYEQADGSVVAAELFDYEQDPHETKNHAEDPAYADALAEMNRLLDNGWKAVRP